MGVNNNGGYENILAKIKETRGSADSVYEAFSFPDGRATSAFGEPPLTFNGDPTASRAVEAAKEIFSAGVSAKKIAVLGQRVAGLVVAGAVVSAKDAKTVAGILEAAAEYDFGEHFHPHRAATYLSSKQGDLMDEKSRRDIISILAGMFSPRRAEELIALAVSSLSKEGSPSAEILSVATERIGSLLTPRKTAELMVVAKNPASVEKNLRRSKDAGLLALHFFSPRNVEKRRNAGGNGRAGYIRKVGEISLFSGEKGGEVRGRDPFRNEYGRVRSGVSAVRIFAPRLRRR